MANVKKIISHTDTGKTVYCIITREADGYLLNDADGAFASAPADPYLSLSEHATIKGRYSVNESRTIWNDGRYTVAVYRQAGGSPAPASDTIVGTGEMWIVSDTEVAVDVSVSSRLAASAYTAPPSSDVIADAVWDEVLTKATHNVANSAGKRLRLLGGYSVHDGTAQAGGANTITLDVGASATNNVYNECLLVVVAGTAQGEAHHIISYNGTTKVAVIDENWHIQPDATSDFIIFGSSAHDTIITGLAQAGASISITLNGTASSVTGTYVNCLIVIPSGTGAGQARRVTAYDGATKIATITPAWTTMPDATSAYMLYPAIDGDKIGFIEKWILNKLVESPAGTWKLYDDDSVTVLKTWTWDSGTSTRSKAV